MATWNAASLGAVWKLTVFAWGFCWVVGWVFLKIFLGGGLGEEDFVEELFFGRFGGDDFKRFGSFSKYLLVELFVETRLSGRFQSGFEARR